MFFISDITYHKDGFFKVKYDDQIIYQCLETFILTNENETEIIDKLKLFVRKMKIDKVKNPFFDESLYSDRLVYISDFDYHIDLYGNLELDLDDL
jgi:hypothetical protein